MQGEESRTSAESARPSRGEREQRRRPPRWNTAVNLSAWGYLALLAFVCVFLHFVGDQWWPATLVLFGPRWLLALPLLLLTPLAVLRHRSLLLPVSVATWLCTFPLLGFCVPWRGALSVQSGPRLRVLSCNIHWGSQMPRGRLRQLISEFHPDVVALQENSGRQDEGFAEPGWNVLRDGELLLASRFRMRDLGPVSPGEWQKLGPIYAGTAHYYEIEGFGRVIPFINVHLASPHNDFSAALRAKVRATQSIGRNSAERMRQSQIVAAAAQQAGKDVLIAGDFNTPCESFIFRRMFPQFSDAFSVAGWGFGWTYYHRGTAVRIDHVLVANGWRCIDCRALPNIGSPHRALLADFVGAD